MPALLTTSPKMFFSFSGFGSTTLTGKPASSALKNRGSRDFEWLYDLIVAGYKPRWSEAQQNYFERQVTTLRSGNDFFLSFTSRPADLQADTEAMIEHLATGKPLDPEAARRIRQRSERIRQEILATHGIQDIGVQIIREIRGDLAQP